MAEHTATWTITSTTTTTVTRTSGPPQPKPLEPRIYTTGLVYYAGAVAGKSSLGNNGYPGPIGDSVFDTWETHLGKQHPVVHVNQRRMNSGTSYTFDQHHKPALQNIWDSGRIPFVTFGYWDLGQRANNHGLRLAAIADGADDPWLEQWAAEAAAWKHPFWWRPWWEWNVRGMWHADGDFPWQVGSMTDTGHAWTNWAPVLGGTNPADGSKDSDFVRAWRHLDDVLQAAGATNVSLVWCPNNLSADTSSKTNPAQTGPLSDFWPGNRADGTPRVQLIAPDGYQKGSSGDGLGTTYASMYQIFRGGASTALLDVWGLSMACDTTQSVPMGFGETHCYLLGGIDRGVRARYLSQALAEDIPRLNAECGNRLAVVSWFWEYAANNWGAADLDVTSPQNGAAVFNTRNEDFEAFKAGLASPLYLEHADVMPPDLLPLRPYV